MTFLLDDNYASGIYNIAGHGHRTEGGAARESQMEGNCRRRQQDILAGAPGVGAAAHG
jgi:hypothetical protein